MKKVGINRVGIVGAGNVGSHMAKAFSQAGYEVEVILESSRSSIRSLSPDMLNQDLFLICVPDDSIGNVAGELAAHLKRTGLLSASTDPASTPSTDPASTPSADPSQNDLPVGVPILAHTSGSTPLSTIDIDGVGSGVFYPLQTFTREVQMDYGSIPFFVEGSEETVTTSLESLAGSVSGSCHRADSQMRQRMHIAAVFAANFANHMVTLGMDILEDDGIPGDVLDKLLEQSYTKLRKVGPKKGQTGPAVRGDHSTINRHLETLKELQKDSSGSSLYELYDLISKSIQSKHTHE